MSRHVSGYAVGPLALLGLLAAALAITFL